MTSRGCPNGCAFRHVGAKEGLCAVKVANVSDFWDGQKRIEVLDPNITACREKRDLFRERYEEMLRTLDNDTGGTYSAEIGRKLKESEYYSYSYSCQFKKMLAPEFVDIRRSLPLKTRLILRCKAMFPGAVLGLRRRKVRGGGGEK